MLGIEARWGVAGLTISAGVASWIEFVLLRRTLNRRIGRTGLPTQHLAKLWLAAIVAALLAWSIRHFWGHHSPVILAAMVLGPYGIAYFGATHVLGVDEAGALFARALGIVRRK